MKDFNDIKEGDKVMIKRCVAYGWGCGKLFWVPVKVDRTTKTQIVIGHRRFKKDDGCEIGAGRYDRIAHIGDKADETKEKNDFVIIVKSWRDLRKKIDKIENPDVEKVSIEKLNTLHGLLDKYIAELSI